MFAGTKVIKLARRNRVHYPNWQLVRDDVPLGKEYILLSNNWVMLRIENTELNQEMDIPCLYVVDRNGNKGMLPVELFDLPFKGD